MSALLSGRLHFDKLRNFLFFQAEKVAACEKVKKLERRLQRTLDATAPNLHSALWNHGARACT